MVANTLDRIEQRLNETITETNSLYETLIAETLTLIEGIKIIDFPEDFQL